MNHVVLPRVLPTEKLRYFQELELMAEIVKTVEILSKSIPLKTVELLQKLKQFHYKCEPDAISKEINKLRPGDTFAMFVYRQNCVILIHMPPSGSSNNEHSDDVVVATFPGNIRPSEIYSHDSDLEVGD